MLAYTIGFIVRGDEVLMLNRTNQPMQGIWHGVGGKVEPGENPQNSMLREMLEETGLRFEEQDMRFAGIVTWEKSKGVIEGMYAFVAELDPNFHYPTPLETEEGVLAWKSLNWLCEPDNIGVGEHVKRFLPMMLNSPEQLHEYRCTFKQHRLTAFEVLPLFEDAVVG